MKTRSPRALARTFVALVLLLLAPRTHPADAAKAELAGAKELSAALHAIIAASPIDTSRAGIYVADVETGQPVFSRDPDALLNPASNVKLVTTAAALARLGPDFRFDTEFYVDAGTGSGTEAARTLYVKGKGDPSLITERLWAIAGDLYHLGLRRVGDVVVDDSYFDGEHQGPGFDQETGDKSYLAPAGAASLNWNTVAIHVGPGDRRGGKARVELEPASDLFELDVRATTVAPGGRRRLVVSSVPGRSRQRIIVEGRIPQGTRLQTVWRRIDDPSLYLGHTLRRLLELRGVKFAGRVRSGTVPGAARLLHVAQSESLAEIVRRLNKTSNNFVAEQLLKTLGAQVSGVPGTWPKGVEAVDGFLAEVGIPRGSYVMKNGSGLNDTNRFSARQLVTLLRAMWGRFPLHAEYLVSLPVAGRDGTIRWRMEGTDAEGRLRAKTGTLENATTLSGYVETSAHRVLAFAILVNDFPGRTAPVARSIDAIGAALAASGGAPGAVGAVVAAARAPEGAPALAADLAAQVRTYYGLGHAGDRRNVPFLRSALRSERDPALRLAIGECLYLSDPDGDTARRTFLDAIPADPQVLARLWAAAAPSPAPLRGAEEIRGQGAGAPGADLTPILPSLGDLAADANPDALARLVDLAPAAALDGGLSRALSAVLADVAMMAPEELVGALRAAGPVAQEAAIGALGDGVARSDEREHPFPASLRELAAREDETGAFAKVLQPRIAAAIAAANAARTSPTLMPAAGALPVRPGGG